MKLQGSLMWNMSEPGIGEIKRFMRFRIPMLVLKKVRRLRLPFAFLLFAAANGYAQRPYVPVIPPKDTSTFLIFKDVTAGPYFTGGISRQNEKLPGIAGDSDRTWHSQS